jgi:hypothetical protein
MLKGKRAQQDRRGHGDLTQPPFCGVPVKIKSVENFDYSLCLLIEGVNLKALWKNVLVGGT